MRPERERPGGERGGEVVARFPVRYSETDQQGIVYHAHALVWMEIGRTAYLEAVGFPYAELERDGILFSVTRAGCRWADAARYGETVEVATRVMRLRSRSVTFGYAIRASGRRIATGETTLACLGSNRRVRRIPAALAAALRERATDDADD